MHIILQVFITYPLWYTHRHGNRAIISPAFKSSKQITHSPFGSLRTSSTIIKYNQSIFQHFPPIFLCKTNLPLYDNRGFVRHITI